MALRRIIVAMGTRPEVIKLAPVIRALDNEPRIEVLVMATGQHREQLSDALETFSIVPHIRADFMSDRQRLPELLARVMPWAADEIREHRPDFVVVQGDTLSTLCVALASFLERVPVAHVEAGLRTGSLDEPFPEEATRRMTDVITVLDLPPTPGARDNLLAEGKPREQIVVTGQTAVDAIQVAAARGVVPTPLRGRRLVVVTVHRRESWPILDDIAQALLRIASEHPEHTFLFPMHLNPVIRDAARVLAGVPNVMLAEPMTYGEMAAVMAASELIITDSGGLLEEGVTLGVHVAVLRNVTERPEGLEAGRATLLSTDPDRIVRGLRSLLAAPRIEPLPADMNPYGDGAAGTRAAQAIAWRLGMASRPADWAPHPLAISVA